MKNKADFFFKSILFSGKKITFAPALRKGNFPNDFSITI